MIVWPLIHNMLHAHSSLTVRQCGPVRHLLQEAGDVLPTAAWPPGQRSAVQELWRHDERSFPNGFTVITVAIMLNPKAVSIESKSHTEGGGEGGGTHRLKLSRVEQQSHVHVALKVKLDNNKVATLWYMCDGGAAAAAATICQTERTIARHVSDNRTLLQMCSVIYRLPTVSEFTLQLIRPLN